MVEGSSPHAAFVEYANEQDNQIERASGAPWRAR